MPAFDATQISTIALFCKAAELSSFSAAAEVLGLTPASVSRAIKRLEERLGVRLFSRTTRNVRLTSEGELYWQECRQALEQIAEAERTISGHQKVPSGLLRISVGTLYANFRLLPLLHEFTATYPQIELELSLSNRVADIVEEGYDLAIRVGTPQDSRLIVHKLEDATVGIFATPAYLARHGVPQQLDDLAQHDCLQFILPTTGRPMPWILQMPDGQPLDHQFHSRFRLLDDALGCISWGQADGGLFQTYHFITAPALARGELLEVMHAYGGRSRQFSITYPQNRHLSARVRSFVDFLLQRLRHPAGQPPR
ncbi:LysR family transcriptional regulator [Aquitalea aquatica]|uniref:LysR family transcriptional regulator n=1 Tax=Aquitalea aquatica TaxID=3044273 RepID=A0A838YGT8_9NEIS|nr:LysR family transcriptional regulator [Aquitalea magnusonii]MBA4710255.1 LysR family transcriptional regulator [Aquitalea magnusonii]